MKKILVFFFLTAIFIGCTKSNNAFITGTVVAQPSCASNAWLVRIDNPQARLYSFLCSQETALISSALYNCGNSVFILNMPAALAVDVKKIKFSKWEDKGLWCFSSNLAPHHLEVADLSEQ